MKKMLISFVLILYSLVSSAQWSVTYLPKDDLLGKPDGYINLYQKGGMKMHFTDDSMFVIESSYDFLCEADDDAKFAFIDAIVGFYEDEHLIERELVTLMVPMTDPKCAACQNAPTNKIAEDVIAWLKTRGPVRIVTRLKDKHDFDLFVPMNKDLIFNIIIDRTHDVFPREI